MGGQSSDITAHGGVGLLTFLFSTRLRWVLRSYGTPDRGVDGVVDLTDDDRLNGQMLAVQIKTGQSYFKKGRKGWHFYFDRDHFDYWTNYSIPVIIVLVDDVKGEAFWEQLTTTTITKRETEWRVVVPFEQRIDADSKPRLQEIAYRSSNAQSQLNRLILDLPYIRECLRLEAAEEATSLTLKTHTDYDGNMDVTMHIWHSRSYDRFPSFSYPIAMDEDIEQVLRRQFPWARFELDEDMYVEHEWDKWREECCWYDETIDQFMPPTMSFSDYRETLPRVRPSSIHGDMAEYELLLTVNDVGRGIDALEPFLTERTFGAGNIS